MITLGHILGTALAIALGVLLIAAAWLKFERDTMPVDDCTIVGPDDGDWADEPI